MNTSKRTIAVSRRSFLSTAGAATAGIGAIALANPFSALGAEKDQTALPKPNKNVMMAGVQSMGKLIGKMRSQDGAAPEDFRETTTALTTMFLELDDTGWNKYMDRSIKNADLDNPPVSEWLSAHSARIRKVAPSITEADLEQFAWNINPDAKAMLAGNSFAALQRKLLTHLSEAEGTARASGVVRANLRLKRTGSGKCALLSVMAATLALCAIFAPEIEVAVILGVVLTLGDVTAIAGIGYALAAAGSC